ncbi:MAG TPA: TOBE domain-containing protein [Cytophagaceae bacterium]|jgi:molybdate transport system regulatory protein|nr:TOBE domain-containing protein [Cytophagaceae bacterium]
MNKLTAEISDIQTSGDIALLKLYCEGSYFYSMMIHHREDYIYKGNLVYMVFKETELSIGKDLKGGLSIRNRFQSVIEHIEKGTLLSEVKLNFNGHLITSLITTQSAEALALQVSDRVEGLLKTTELFMMKYE